MCSTLVKTFAYMLDDWIRFWHFDVIRNTNLLNVWNMNSLVVGNWDWNLLDDCQSLFFVMMMMTVIMTG